MKVSSPRRLGWRAALLAAATIAATALPTPAPAQLLPWEITVAEIEAGRLRGLAQRLAKQNLLYSLRLGGVRKADLVQTSERIERILDSLEQGNPSYSVPSPWTRAIRDQLREVEAAWGPLQRIATASAYDTFRVSREYVPRDSRVGDPLLLRYFDDLAETLVERSEVLLALYHDECAKTGLEVCGVARDSGYAAMLVERAAKEAVQVIAGIDAGGSRKELAATLDAYRALRAANQQSTFFAAATDPARGLSAKATGELLASLRADWDAMEAQFKLLAAGDVENFDLPSMLVVHERLVDKTERVTAAFVRYASLEYGS